MAGPAIWGSAMRGRRGVMATAEVARDLMTSPAVTIGPDAAVAEAARLMSKRRVKRLPVVAADGQLTGIISRLGGAGGGLRASWIRGHGSGPGVEDLAANDQIRRLISTFGNGLG